MAFLLKDTIHQSLVDSVYNEFISQRANYYYYIGKVIEWDDQNTPETPNNTRDYEYDVRSNIISVKKINVRDVSLVIPRRDWVSGVVYDQYNPNYSVDNPADSGATSLKESTFYVLTSSFGVFKCIYNNNGGESTIEPSGFDPSPVTYNDGYVWKFLYTVPLSTRNRFLTSTYMPVQRAVTNAFYSNGEISSVVVDANGSGYLNNAAVTLTVSGSFIGANGNSIANLTPVFNDNGSFIDVIVKNPGNNYNNATITITDHLGAGNTYYKGVSHAVVYNVGSGYTNAVRNNTTVTVTTTGASQPTSNAKLSPIYSNNNNSLVSFNVLSNGSGYTTAAKNNTTITISTSGASQPSANATANLYYNTGAVLTPVILNGVIDRILIEDPGIGYSANNRTTISTIGDGTGAVLQPVINDAGELVDIIIASRGSGYTYLDIQIVGTGANANAYAVLSTGDLNSFQSLVELSAIDGGIHSLVVDNVGNNYSNANVAVYGDGSGFIGNVVISDNTVSKITVVSPGTNFTFANVIITGSGSNANAYAIMSPVNGHGSDPVSELFADSIMFYSTINNEKNQGININNDYRQFGILKNPKKYGVNQTFTSSLGSSCFLLTLSSVTGLTGDNILRYIDTNNQTRHLEIVEVVSGTKQVLVLNKDNAVLEAGLSLLNDANDSFTITAVNETPDINKMSGELLFIDNRTTISYSDNQLVTLKTIIKL